MLAGLRHEPIFPRIEVAESCPGVRRTAWDLAGTEMLGGKPRVGARKIELVGRRLEKRRRRLEPDRSLLVVHVRVFAILPGSPRSVGTSDTVGCVDAELESAKERAWREVAAIDAAYARGELDDAGWHAAMASLIVPSYLAARTPEAGSGHSGIEAEWEYSRGIVVEAIAGHRTFLDVGCANGLLMESMQRWVGVEPYGLDITPDLAELARTRYPHWRERIFVGNAFDWTPPERFDAVRTGLEYVPVPRRRELVAHLLENVVAPGGRLIVGKYTEEVAERRLEAEVASWGFPIAGRAERAHRVERRLAYRVFWIDRAG
jgi:2-polyprenyl-3-methyl-5-hydroxy-6-metoxy-1,4-benzoquinol methylase